MTNPDKPPTSMFERAVHEAAEGSGGRWKKNTQVSIAGTGPIPHAGTLVGPQWCADIVPPEASLGYSVDSLPDLTTVDGSPREWLQPPEPEPDYEPTEPININRRGL